MAAASITVLAGSVVDSHPDAFALVGEALTVTYLNQAGVRLLGEDAVGAPVTSVWPDYDEAWWRRQWERARTGEPAQTQHHAADGRWFRLRLQPLDGELAVWCTDVSQEIRALETTLENMAGAGAVVSGGEFRFTTVNAAYAAFAPGKRLLGRRFADVWPAAPGIVEILTEVRESGAARRFENMPVRIQRGEHGAGEEAWFTWSVTRLPGPDGALPDLLITAYETTAEMRYREQANARAALLEAVVESLPDAVYIVSPGGEVRANGRAAELEGRGPGDPVPAPQQLVAALDLREADGEPAEPAALPFSRALRGETVRTEMRMRTPSGEERRVRVASAPVVRDGRVDGSVTLVSDITGRHRLESELRHSREWFERTQQAGGVGVWEIDLERQAVTASPQAFALFGAEWREATIPIQLWRERIHPDDLPELRYSSRPFATEYRALLPDGAERWLLSRGQWLSPTRLAGITIDIDARKRAEENLKLSEARYRNLVESAQEGVWSIDLDGVTTYVNESMARMLGCAADEIVGRSAFDFVYPEDRGAGWDIFVQRLKLEGGLSHEFRYRRADGSPLWARVTSGLVYGADK